MKTQNFLHGEPLDNEKEHADDMAAAEDTCPCGSGLPKEPEYDGQGIFLCYACDKCRAEKLGGYRPEILRPYSQADIDEPLDED